MHAACTCPDESENMKKTRTEPKARIKILSTGKKTLPKKRAGSEHTKASFPIIGIGASAGRLEAFELFFKTMPTDSGKAFVLVSHLDPGHASLLSGILQRNTTMPVYEAKDQTPI